MLQIFQFGDFFAFQLNKNTYVLPQQDIVWYETKTVKHICIYVGSGSVSHIPARNYKLYP